MRALVGLAAGLATLTVAAPAYAETSISFYSDDGDFIGGGRQRVFEPANTSSLGAKMDGDTVLAWAVGGPYREGYSFEFAAPPGEQLEPRNYTGAERLPFRRAGHPGLDVTGENRGCNTLGGRFELRDLAHDGAGNVQRLWVLFEQHCEGNQAAGWGEIRVNVEAPPTVRWPPLDSWRDATPVPVSAPAEVVGSNAFRVEGGHVRFVPDTPGTHEAVLRAGGTETRLEGFAYGGTTSATVEVIAGGDVAGQPGTYTYGPQNAQFGGRTYDTETSVFVAGADDRWFEGRFGAGGATPLTPGAYGPATTDYGPQPWLRVSGSPIFCSASGGDFTVHEISRLPDGNLRSFDVSFEQDCYADHRAAHRGRLRYRAGSTVALAPWLIAGPRPRLPAPVTQPSATPTTTSPTTTPPAAAAVAVPRPTVRATWRSTRASTRARRLIVEHVPDGARVQVRCLGRRCPWSRRTIAVRDGRADVGKPLSRLKLRPGMVLELRVGTVLTVRYTIRRARTPAVRWVRGRPGPAATGVGTASAAAAPPPRHG